VHKPVLDLALAGFLALAHKVLIRPDIVMKNGGHAPVNETTARRAKPTKARRGRPRKNGGPKNHGQHDTPPNAHSTRHQSAPHEAKVGEHLSDETVARAKGLLAATLRVWELKHRIHE